MLLKTMWSSLWLDLVLPLLRLRSKCEPKDGAGPIQSASTTTGADIDVAVPTSTDVSVPGFGVDVKSARYEVDPSMNDVKFDDDVRATIAKLSATMEAMMNNRDAMIATMAEPRYQRELIDAKRTLKDVNHMYNS